MCWISLHCFKHWNKFQNITTGPGGAHLACNKCLPWACGAFCNTCLKWNNATVHVSLSGEFSKLQVRETTNVDLLT